MNLDPNRLVRGAAVSQYLGVSRGGTVGMPKSRFGARLPTTTNVLASMDRVHWAIRGCSSASQLADLLDEYVGLAAVLAGTYGVAAPFVPGGAVLSAAVSGLGSLGLGSLAPGAAG
jgi:hypothetical protein